MTDELPPIIETDKRRSGAGWVIAVGLVAALVVGIFLFSQMSSSEVAKDNPVTNAAV